MRKLPATVVLLGFVSLLNDVASDMIMPLLPVFLSVTLGAGPAIIGLIEGVAEATASLLKLWSGRLGDRGIGHKRLAVVGYSLSNLVRPCLGIASSWGAVMFIRFTDRIGKGIRTAPRDALLSASVDTRLRGRAFGLHRSMDHSGALIGPLLASGLLALGLSMQQVFLASVVPGALAVILLMVGLRAVPVPHEQVTLPPLRWSLLHPRLRAMVIAAGSLALVTVPDAFLLLWLSKSGISVFWIPLIWAAAHGVRALVALPGGHWSDHYGRVPVLLAGWTARAVLLLCVPFVHGWVAVVILFFLYAGATASSEGAERAVIGDFADKAAQGTAFGLYNMVVGIFALPGALWFGVVWEGFGMTSAFVLSALLTMVIAVVLASLARKTPAVNE
ncbi:MAG TPA: MFS transporter [Gammaproteobacteria bacterium]|nr:MFS transporter [Gammaproteobacteria bacterium]